MQMEIRRAKDRGHADHGWLDTNHTFSFAGYYDPRFMGFGALRVINEDRVSGGRGFGTHPHRDMEIISYVVDGALEHRDTIGTGSVIRPGEVQVMSAGTGVAHSEFNHHTDQDVHFLQIWVLPRNAGNTPRYDQKTFETGGSPATLVVSADGRDGSLQIDQDVDLHRVLLDEGQRHDLPLRHARSWVQVIAGELVVNDAVLKPGDGLAVVDAERLTLQANEAAHALVFDLE
ncbi:MAG: pirin family protein [Myxococcota bacterium]